MNENMGSEMHLVLAITSVMFLAIWSEVSSHHAQAGSWQSVSVFGMMR